MKVTLLPKRKGVLAVELALFAGLIAFVTQPFVQPVKSSPPAADPARLERDVRKLSVDFFRVTTSRPAWKRPLATSRSA